MKEVIHEIYGFTGLITNGDFAAFGEWKNPHNRYFKDDHLNPAAGDYEPIPSGDKQKTRIEVKQCTETLVWMHDPQEQADHKQP
ncbi:hypothetical protein [Sporosarcina sp. YIM B06819]|uniref:hypothetical protein n=1 Tax=Sporosarcina sp. YIM B06819 TaxID=3081769 RepID=UPI00298C072D|nr:hypothetical protein [Sporosarcina sp. YIM B06819]